jgi:hypothetical protein
MNKIRPYGRFGLTYVDVLGFSDLISESMKDELVVDEIGFELGRFVDALEQFGPKGAFNAFNFSDHCVRATKLPPRSNVATYLDREGFYLAERQLQMVMRGWFLRGAITVGNLAVSEKLIFGPALVRAHILESTIAVYPRIVIDPELNELTNANSSFARDYQFTDRDGITCIDYLFGVFLRRFEFPGESERDPWRVLEDHRQACEEFLNSGKAVKDLRVRQKAAWVAFYHNHTLKRLAERFGKRPEAERFSQYVIVHDFCSPELLRQGA